MATSRESDKFIVRLPDGMRSRIKAAADANGRSMNAEVVQTLEAAYPEPDPHELAKSMSTMIMELIQLRKERGYSSPEEKERVRRAFQAMDEVVGKKAELSSDEDFSGAWVKMLELVEALMGEPIDGLAPATREQLTEKRS